MLHPYSGRLRGASDDQATMFLHLLVLSYFAFFFERSTAQLKLLQKHYLELDLAKVVLLLTKSLPFQFYFRRKSKEISH